MKTYFPYVITSTGEKMIYKHGFNKLSDAKEYIRKLTRLYPIAVSWLEFKDNHNKIHKVNLTTYDYRLTPVSIVKSQVCRGYVTLKNHTDMCLYSNKNWIETCDYTDD